MASRPVLVLRPQPGNDATCAAARARGIDAIAAPLFAYRPLDWALPAGGWDGLLAGSAAVFAQGGPALAALRAIPVHAVGAATAGAAQQAGFAVAAIGHGGLQSVVKDLVPGRYLRLAGQARVPLTSPHGVSIDDVVVYAAAPLPLAPAAAELVRRGPVLVLLHSAEAARHWALACLRHDLPRARVALACLAPRIAPAAGPDWENVRIAASPDDEALLSLAQQMCQTV
jgi:uroporphyrinogen-III synthase